MKKDKKASTNLTFTGSLQHEDLQPHLNKDNNKIFIILYEDSDSEEISKTSEQDEKISEAVKNRNYQDSDDDIQKREMWDIKTQ